LPSAGKKDDECSVIKNGILCKNFNITGIFPAGFITLTCTMSGFPNLFFIVLNPIRAAII
jgi:hypothetical protein